MPTTKLSKRAKELAVEIIRRSLFLGEWTDHDMMIGQGLPLTEPGVWDECVDHEKEINAIIKDAENAVDDVVSSYLPRP